MNTAQLFNLCLALHLTGLVVMAGITLADMVTWRYFWNTWSLDKTKAALAMGLMQNFPRLLGIGAAVLILSGVGMMAITHGLFGEQLWFRIKIGLVVAVVINGAVVARPQVLKLQKLIAGDIQTNALQQQISSVRSRIAFFHISQLMFFITIIVLSAFKFN